MSDGMGREPAYLSSHATNRYFIPNWGHTYTGDLLQPGEWAEYYLTVRFRDGRQGQVSNRVTVAAPANPPSTTEQ